MVYKVDDESKKNSPIVVRVTKAVRDHLTHEAATHGVTLSKLVRARVTGTKIVSRVDSQAIAELRRQGGLLKHLVNTDRLDYQDIKSLLEKIEATIDTLGRQRDRS